MSHSGTRSLQSNLPRYEDRFLSTAVSRHLRWCRHITDLQVRVGRGTVLGRTPSLPDSMASNVMPTKRLNSLPLFNTDPILEVQAQIPFVKSFGNTPVPFL